ncbi:37s ribosomal protein rsm22 [Colletotrichum asianum]
MRLINVNTRALEEFYRDPPPYAILSHTWGPDEEELLYDDIKTEVTKPGIGKLKLDRCCEQAKEDGLDYVWIDTCCINRANATELGEAINSMYRWYQSSHTCYAYLVDVDEGDRSFHDLFRASRWFCRGWTLQELLAPKDVVFYDKSWRHLGSKHQLAGIVEDITGIPRPFLLGLAGLQSASIAQRMSWAAKRTTTKEEDLAYCLLGIFNVMIPMIYGEGSQAFTRLQEQIMKKTPDDSILAWGLSTDSSRVEARTGDVNKFGGVLAATPAAFLGSETIVFGGNLDATGILGGFLHAKLGFYTSTNGQTFGLLNCRPRDSTEKVVGIPLCRVHPGEDSDEYIRPRGGRASLLSKSSTQNSSANPKSMRILESLQFHDEVAFDRRHGFCIETPSKGELVLVDVHPQERWEKKSSFILTGADFSRDSVQRTWLKFRHAASFSEDFVIALELEIKSCQPKARCHVMTVSRTAILDDITGEASIRDYVFGNTSAHTQFFNLQAKLTQEQLGAQPVFMVRLYSMDSPSGVSVDASLELSLIERGKQLKRLLKEDKRMRPKLLELPKSIREKTTAVDETTAKLKAVQEELDRLQQKKDELSAQLEANTQELASLVDANRTLVERETEIFDFVSSAGTLPPHCGQERALQWLEGIIDHLSTSAPSKDATINDMPDRFHRAFMQNVANGNLAALRFLADNHVNIRCETTERVSALSMAIFRGHLAAVSWLLDQGMSIDSEDGEGVTPLFRAAFHRNQEAVALLLDRGASINARSSGGNQRTPLAIAARRNEKPVCQLLIDRGADVNIADEFGLTPLALAARAGHSAILPILIKSRADMELQDEKGLTPAYLAAQQRHLSILTTLIKNGANIEARDQKGRTLLAYAASKNDEEMAQLLLDQKARIEAWDDEKQTPLALAEQLKHTPMIRLLLKRKANAKFRDKLGRTSLGRAVERRSLDTVKLLLDLKVNVESKDNSGCTALALAAESGYLTISKTLIEGGANVNTTDHDLDTPINLAASRGHTSVVELLLEHSADLELANTLDGWTPLMQAVHHGNEEMAKLLLEKGAKANAKDNHGRTPLFIAIDSHRSSLVPALLDHGARTDVKHDGLNPLYHAIMRKNKDSVRLLVDRGADTSKLKRLVPPLQYAKDLIVDEETGSKDGENQDSESSRNDAKDLTRAADIETTVREAKQRFRDTLPKGYLSEEEYRLYERWYGPPLRETTPEDIGIEYLNEKTSEAAVRKDGSAEPALLRRGEGGSYEEVSYVRKGKRKTPDQIFEEIVEDNLASELSTEVEPAQEPAPEAEPEPEERENYINVVARNRREYDALMKLQKDFEASARAYEESERAQAHEEDEQLRDEEREMDEDEEDLDEREDGIQDQSISNRASRLHPYSREGHFSTNPATVSMPYAGFISPVNTMLSRTDIKHVQEAAEKAFGGPGLPHSPATPASKMNLPQNPIGMAVWQARMSEIDADAFISTFLPPTYASAMASLVEVRKRLGTEWMRKLFERGNGEGPRILDVGAGGAGLLAWQDIIRAEWEAMQSRGEVSGRGPPGKQSVVIGAEKLRERISKFLQNTSFLPRLPDYLHSVDQQEQHIDANETPQPRKMFDVIIASHLLLPVKEGHRRKAILNQIWSLLNPEGGVLIVLEKGQPSGFEAVAEVRDRLLQEFLIPPGGEELKPEEQDLDPSFERVKEHGMIIAPCTNHKSCPMYLVPGRSKGRKDYCHFTQRFVRPPFLQRIMGATHRNHDDVQFSYVAIQRGTTAKSGPLAGDKATTRALEGYEDAETAPDMLSLPRQILPPIKRRGHVTLDVCTPSAKIERWTIPKSFSKQAYHDARKAKWGDLWALGAKTRLQRNVRLGRPEAEDDGGVRAQRANAAARKKRNVVEVGINEHGVIGDPDAIEARAQPQQRRKSKRGAALHDLKKQLAEKED